MIIVMILIVFAIFVVFFCISNNKRMNSKNVKCFAEHVQGLGIPKGARCSIELTEDVLNIVFNKFDFNVDVDDIADISIVSEEDIVNQKVSSVGGAVAGALLFGPLGAIVGGRVKNVKTKTSTKYFVIFVNNEEGIHTISFECGDIVGCNSIINRFRLLDNNKQVEISI